MIIALHAINRMASSADLSTLDMRIILLFAVCISGYLVWFTLGLRHSMSSAFDRYVQDMEEWQNWNGSDNHVEPGVR